MLRKIRSGKPHGEAAERGDRGNNSNPLLEALLALKRVPKPAEDLIHDAVAGFVVNLQRRPPFAERDRSIPPRASAEMGGPGLVASFRQVVREMIIERQP